MEDYLSMVPEWVWGSAASAVLSPLMIYCAKKLFFSTDYRTKLYKLVKANLLIGYKDLTWVTWYDKYEAINRRHLSCMNYKLVYDVRFNLDSHCYPSVFRAVGPANQREWEDVTNLFYPKHLVKLVKLAEKIVGRSRNDQAKTKAEEAMTKAKGLLS